MTEDPENGRVKVRMRQRKKQGYEVGDGMGQSAFVSTGSKSISGCVMKMQSSGLDTMHLKSLWKIYMMVSIR